MPWVEVLAVFVASHLTGDFLFQTDWQAQNKDGGLGPDPQKRRALAMHIATYTLAFVPAFIVLADDIGWAVLGVAAAIAIPHMVQDDGRLLAAYVRNIKRSNAGPGALMVAVDQTFHFLALFAVALVAAS